MEIKNAGVVVTGGSEGLGAALGAELAARGARVALVARRVQPLEQAVARIRAAGGDAHAIVADMGDKHAIHAIAGQAGALVGPVDLLVHNASTLGPTPLRPLLDTECEDFERVLQVNLLGPFRLSKVLAGNMALRGHGTVVHISSDAAVEGYPDWGPYGVSKAALDHLGRIWAAELESSGVRMLSVDPGEMDTRMHAAALPDANPSDLLQPGRVAQRIADMLAAGEEPSGSRWVSYQEAS